MTASTKDFVLGTATLALAAAYYAAATRIPETTLADAVGPAGLPKSYAVLLAGLSGILMVRSLSQGARDSRQITQHYPWLRAARLLLIGVAYLIIVPWLGYVASVAGLIMAATFEGGLVSRRVIVTAVLGAVSFWLLFVVLLGIPQPPGMWPALF